MHDCCSSNQHLIHAIAAVFLLESASHFVVIVMGSDLVGLAANWIGFGWIGSGWIGSCVSKIWIGLNLIGLDAPGAPMAIPNVEVVK